DEIREVVAYAKKKHITIIPEIEMPGHASAALAAYPELGCKENKDYHIKSTWGIFEDIYCPSEETFTFLENVLTEVKIGRASCREREKRSADAVSLSESEENTRYK